VPPAAHPGLAPPGSPPQPFGARPARTFALAIALPALLLYIVGAVLVFGALTLMAREIDRVADRRGVAAMHAALDGLLGGLSSVVSDEGTSNEAYLNVVVSANPAWLATTWGTSARLGDTYDTVVVTDADGAIVFGENSVGAIRGDVARRFPAARTMLKQLDAGIAATGEATVISGFAADQAGTTALAAISIHRNTAGAGGVPRHLRRVLWLARHVTPAVLQDVAMQYQTPLPALVSAIVPDSSAIDLRDADGNLSGTLAWVPDRPGERAFGNALGLAGAIFGVIGAVLAAGLGIVRRAMLRRADAVAAAFATGPTGLAAPSVAAGHAAGRADDSDPDAAGPIDGIMASAFEIAYQPIFDVRAETLAGVEGLLRWRGATGVAVLQESLAARPLSVLLDRIGILAVRHASSELAPLLGVELCMAVTPAQLQSAVFAEKVTATLGATQLPASRLQLVVDATLLPPIDSLLPSIAALRLTGAAIGLDNFTLSPATIPYLRAGLVDRVRLSPRLTRGIGSETLQLSLAEASIAAAHGAGLAVTVPGVSARADFAPLLRLGCRQFQGEVFAGPMPLAALTALVLAPVLKAS
jgi:EAL domain-containing protein (putative c-di-GMP-specific phosphodiesterase class I)